MNKKLIATAMIAVMAVSCAGCGSAGKFRKKFIRTKKGEVQGPVLQPYDYSRQFTNKQLYSNHYAFWRASESDLIVSITEGKTDKKVRSQASYSLNQLKDMQNLLIEEKKKVFASLVTELEDIVSKINEPRYMVSHKNLIMSRLEQHYRMVSSNFSYSKMKSFIRPDPEDFVQAEPLTVKK